MLKEFVEAIVGVVTRSVTAQQKVHFEPRPEGQLGEGFLIGADGKTTTLPPVIRRREHGLKALAEMAGAIKWAALKANRMRLSEMTRVDTTDLATRYDPLLLSVWHNYQGATLVMNDDGPRSDTVTLELMTTDIWDCLFDLQDRRPKLDHREFMSLLRFKLCPYMDPGAAVRLLESAKIIEFGTNQNGTSVQSRGQTGFGSDVQSQVKSRVGELPDEIVVMIPIYTDEMLSERVPVRLSIEIDPAKKSFEVAPLIDEMSTALESVMKTMRNVLESYSFDEESRMAYVFYGTP